MTEYDLFRLNGIFDKLRTLPAYNDDFSNDKKNTKYEIYMRPNIQWKHTCETKTFDKITRSDAATILS